MPHSAQVRPGPAKPHRACTIRKGTVRFAERVVLNEVDLTVAPRDRIALVGDNGAGKSTLMRVLAGVLPLNSGEVHMSMPGGVSFAEQRPVFPSGATVQQALDFLMREVRAMEADVLSMAEELAAGEDQEQSMLLARYCAALDAFEARDGYGVDHRLDVALEQLGMAHVARTGPVDALSGGERARLSLAAAVASRPELLLLDEPTNDLDDRAVAWLEDQLAAHRGSLVVVSHDRAFLDTFATDIVAVDDGSLRRYGNGFHGYLAAIASERQHLLERHREWSEELERNEELVASNSFRLDAIPRKQERASFGHGAFRARAAGHGTMSRIKMAKERVARLHADPVPRPPDPLQFTPGFVEHPSGAADETARALTPLLLRAASVRRRADERGPAAELDEVELHLGERWIVEGPNGAGKTTLLRLLAGDLGHDAGTLWRRPGLRVAWLNQDLHATTTRSLVDSFAVATEQFREDASKQLAALGLFATRDFERPLSALSVGQQRRFQIAVAVSVPSDVLLLDEPTNHVSPDLAEQLQAAVDEYRGAVVTVTHDRRWREASASRTSGLRLRVLPGGVTTRPTRLAS